MDTPYGPHKVTATRQLAIPKEPMERVRLRPGDQIYFIEDDREDGTLLIVPIDTMSTWIDRGRSKQPHRSS